MRSEDPPHAAANRWLIAISVMSSAIMEVLDTSVVNVSLPHIAGSLSATVDESTWVLTSYLIANAVILPISGWLANLIGRKRLLLTVVTGFTLSSVLCGMAPSLPALILFRVLQGTTGGGLQPLSQAILLEEFPDEERGKAMAFWSLGILAAPVLGPTLGGWITDTYSWRWVFYINLPIGLFSLVMISLFLYDPPYIRRGGLRVDLWGLGMLAVGMGALQIVFDEGQEEDWLASHFMRDAGGDSRRRADGLCNPRAHHAGAHRPFPVAAVPELCRRDCAGDSPGIRTVWQLGSAAAFPCKPSWGGQGRRRAFGHSPRGIANAMCLPVVGYLLGKGWDGRWMLAFGFVVASLAFFGYSEMSLQSGTWDILLHQINQGVGQSFVFVPLTTLAMEPIPKAETGYATSLYSVVRNIGSSMGVSFVTTWAARRSQFHQSILAAHVTRYDLHTQQFLGHTSSLFFHRGFDWTAAGNRGLGVLYNMLQQQAALLSFIEVFRIMGFLFLASLPLVLLMRRARQGGPGPMAD